MEGPGVERGAEAGQWLGELLEKEGKGKKEKKKK